MTAAVRLPASPAVAPSTAPAAAQVAKAALRRLALERVEPTPDNYARAYRAEAGDAASSSPLPGEAAAVLGRLVATLVPHMPEVIGAHSRDKLAELLLRSMRNARWDHAGRVLDTLLDAEAPGGADAASLAKLLERLLAGLERGSRQWTSARRKESVQRVLDGSRNDARRLQQRLGSLIASWETPTGEPDAHAQAIDASSVAPAGATLDPVAAPSEAAVAVPVPHRDAWPTAFVTLGGSLAGALADDNAAADAGTAMATQLRQLVAAIAADGPQTHLEALTALCGRTGYAVQHRNHLLEQLGALCRELTSSLGDLAEDDSWARGQLDAARLRLEEGLTARSVRSVIDLLHHTHKQQHAIRTERSQARDALKTLIARMLGDLGELGSQTDSFNDNIGRYADRVERADSLENLTGVVSEMVEETRGVQRLVSQTQQRLQSAHQHATALSGRVSELENDLRRLSDEVATDPLTQIANRRGLMQAFEVERARCERDGSDLAVGLLDIDNFKRLNDDLGHGVGDQALVSLAAAVASALRPGDTVARYGGEEFVVLLPLTRLDDAQQLLSRMQRSLTGSLFMHANRQVFVTFSAGVSAYRPGERVEATIERADQALYAAKHAGKNRTCVCP